MWYLVLPLVGCLVAYLYHTLARTSSDEFTDHSIDAYIVEGDDDVKPVGESAPDKYRRDYETEGRQLLILYGTEYGFSEEIAKLLFDRITELNSKDVDSPLQPRLVNMRDYELVDFYQEHVCLIIVSTSGDGVPPSDARIFYDYVLQNHLGLSHLEYSLLALGDSNYPQFCKTGRLLDSRLSDLGCNRIIKRHDVDMEDWSVINSWLKSVLCYLATASIETKMDYLRLSDVTEEKYNRHNPFMATLKNKTGSIIGNFYSTDHIAEDYIHTDITCNIEEPQQKYRLGTVKKLLTNCIDKEDKETIHCEFDITGSDLNWTSGDALGIYPRNNPPEVTRLLDAMDCSGTESANKPSWAYTCSCSFDKNVNDKDEMDLRSVLTSYYDLKSVKPELLSLIRDNLKHELVNNKLYELLENGGSKITKPLQNYLKEREVADVLLDFKPHSLHWKQILGCMKSLQPRYYSISSSPKIDNTNVCVTAAVLRYMSNNIPRTGVTTTYLQDRLIVGEYCPVFMSCNHDFRLPSDSHLPIILIGPGTGIAPFRAFIQERALKEHTGETILYFGCRHRNKDYLYRKELEKWSSDGIITLRVAFSRDQKDKVYVQGLLYEDKCHIWKLINEPRKYESKQVMDRSCQASCSPLQATLTEAFRENSNCRHQKHAYIYVCGDAKYMAHDVHSTLLKIGQCEGHFSENEAVTYFQAMEQDSRYQKDVWVV